MPPECVPALTDTHVPRQGKSSTLAKFPEHIADPFELNEVSACMHVGACAHARTPMCAQALRKQQIAAEKAKRNQNETFRPSSLPKCLMNSVRAINNASSLPKCLMNSVRAMNNASSLPKCLMISARAIKNTSSLPKCLMNSARGIDNASSLPKYFNEY